MQATQFEALLSLLAIYVIYKVGMFVVNAINILEERHETLSNIYPLDKALVNKRNILSFLSYDNRLICLYKGPDSRGRLIVPEGIESIEHGAFWHFLAYKMTDEISLLNRRIVLPKTIKEIDVDNILIRSILVFKDARLKSILRGSESDLEHREIKIKGGLFSDILKECETLEHKEYDDNVPSKLKKSDVDRINTAFSKITDPLMKIRLMDVVHSRILSGELSVQNFGYLLAAMDFASKERYCGKGVIERIYGSVQNAYMRFETKYYEAENIRMRQSFVKRIRTRKSEIRQVIAYVESIAKDPMAFLIDDGGRSEAQGDDVSRQEQN